MKCILVLLLASAMPVAAQRCIPRITPNGSIDWSLLPNPFPPRQAPFTATIPVTGVPGLDVTVSLANTFGQTMAQGSALLDLFTADDLTLTFSRPVSGVRAAIGTDHSRFNHQLSMTGALSPEALGFPNNVDLERNYKFYSVASGVWDELELASPRLASTVQSVTIHGGISIETSDVFIRNVRIQSDPIDASSAVPKAGLKGWFRTDSLTTSSPLTVWPDDSGNHADALASSPENAPVVAGGGPNCSNVVRFDGGAKYLGFYMPINDLNAMTIVMVGAANLDASGGISHSQNAPLFWNETAPWGTTYLSPFQTNVQMRFATGQADNLPAYTRPASIAGDFSISAAIHDGSTDSLFVNGELVLQQNGKLGPLSGASNYGYLGRAYAGSYFTGDIAEILIYGRALSDKELTTVHKYLTGKYQIR